MSGTVLPVNSEASWLGPGAALGFDDTTPELLLVHGEHELGVGALLHGEIVHLERIGLGVDQLDVVQPIEVLERRRSVVLLRRELLENT